MFLIGAGVYAYSSKDKFPPPGGAYLRGEKPVRVVNNLFNTRCKAYLIACGAYFMLHCLHKYLHKSDPLSNTAQRSALCSRDAAQ